MNRKKTTVKTARKLHEKYLLRKKKVKKNKGDKVRFISPKNFYTKCVDLDALWIRTHTQRDTLPKEQQIYGFTFFRTDAFSFRFTFVHNK